MKRLHVHVNVGDLDRAVGYYAALFGTGPTVRKSDYARWMLDDPRVNFAISLGAGPQGGLSHLGIQAENTDELDGLSGQLRTAEELLLEEKDVQCCYARSDKYWGRDPAGIAWEIFHTHGQADTMGGSIIQQPAQAQAADGKSCC